MENAPAVVPSPHRARAVETSVRSLCQGRVSPTRIVTLCEGIERGVCSVGGHSEYRTFVERTPFRGCSIKVSVIAKHQPLRTFSVHAIERNKRREGSICCEPEHCAATAEISPIIQSAADCGGPEIGRAHV